MQNITIIPYPYLFAHSCLLGTGTLRFTENDKIATIKAIALFVSYSYPP